MRSYSLSHLADSTLMHDLAALVARDRATTAELLAHIAEVDARRLYLPAAYPSMYAYCVGELRLSEEAARKRIHAARTARQFPALFAALADGRLHLSAVILLAPYLRQENANELLAAATHKTKPGIGQLIVERFPRLDVPAQVQAIAEPPLQAAVSTNERAPGRVEPLAPEPAARPRVAPLAPQRFALQLTMRQELHDKLRYAQELLGHQIPSGDLAAVLERALDELIAKLERRKFAATSRPRPNGRPSPHPRHIPADVRRTVWQRDGGRCTFVSEAGRRCPARTRLEFDHVLEVARGGQASVAGVRLRCLAHNQYGAECTFGTEFMRHQRQEAQRRATEKRARKAAATAPAPEPEAPERDVAPSARVPPRRGAPCGGPLCGHPRGIPRGARAPRGGEPGARRSAPGHAPRRLPGVSARARPTAWVQGLRRLLPAA